MLGLMTHFHYLPLVMLSLSHVVLGDEDCLVQIKNGTVVGLTKNQVCVYNGIPYAAPPLGPLRFQPPKPAAAWGTLNATKLPSICPQMLFGGMNMRPTWKRISEDCLYLNIFQPRSAVGSSLADLPVMIWIHGGGFVEGDSWDYDPGKLLARGEVIVVVVQYRLGLLGFLSTGDKEAPGNWGLKDQAQAIRWVHENIAAFGGSKHRVTVFGHSAGGAAALLQLISPLNHGLIHRVIAHSGTCTASWSLDKKPFQSAQLMAKRLECSHTSSSKTILSCLREVSWQKIIEEQGKLKLEKYFQFSHPTESILPVVEPRVSGAFLFEDPTKILESGKFPQVPVMLGATKHDGSFILADLYRAWFGPKELDTNAEYLKTQMIPDILKLCQVEEDYGNAGVAGSIGLAYFSGVNRSSWNEIMPGLVDLTSVFAFKSSIEKTAQFLSKRNQNVFLYSFEYHSTLTTSNGGANIPINTGIAHGDVYFWTNCTDLLYLFDLLFYQIREEDRKFAELFSDLWVNFAKFGNPTPNKDLGFQWPAYDILDEAYIKINATPTVKFGYRSSWRPHGFEWN